MSQLLRTWKLYPRQWKLIPARGFNSVRITGRGKTSAQPHTTLCIQFLDRENNDKNNTLPLGKQICFTIGWDYAEILPSKEFLNTEADVKIAKEQSRLSSHLSAFMDN